MAKKLLEQDEAARMLGVSIDKLSELRDRGKLFPKRDGGDWKYDQDDLEPLSTRFWLTNKVAPIGTTLVSTIFSLKTTTIPTDLGQRIRTR